MEGLELEMNGVSHLLSKVQNEVKVLKNNFNAFGKYKFRSVEDIQVAVKPILLGWEAVIVLADKVSEICGIPVVESTATFICPFGEISVTASAGVDIHKKGMDIPQTFGTASSYARKYALGGLLLLDDVADSDAINQHKDEPKKVKLPLCTDILFEKAVARFEGGEKDVFDKLRKAYTLTAQQELEIKEMIA
ncbi:MAG: ERF family protein [Candidatus Fonsibacter sp.]|jgi:hypothetical protein